MKINAASQSIIVNQMKTSKRITVFSAILAFACLAAPPRLLAQEDIDKIEEQGTGEDASDEEQLADPNEALHKPANTWPKGRFVLITKGGSSGAHLGPTGLWGIPMGQNIMVKKVDSHSPADGKVLREDIIYGINGKTFPADRDVRRSFANAITEAETKEAGGKLILDIHRDGELIQVTLQLEVMGSFSATTPYNCEKSEKIVARAEEYMRKGLRPESGYPNNQQYMYAPWHDSALFLLASGNPEMQGLVRRYIHDCIDDVETWKSGGDDGFNASKGWGYGTIKFLFGEYYHRTGDPSVLPYIAMGGFSRGSGSEKPESEETESKSGPFNNWTYPPIGPTRYGLHPHMHMYSTMSDVLANEAGVKINQAKLAFDLNYAYVKRAQYGHVKYCGYANIPIEHRQTEAPEEITEQQMNSGTFSANNGKPAMAAALFSIADGDFEEGVKNCATRSVYAYNVTRNGHGGIWFNGFWTPIGASKAGPEQFQLFMKGQQWCRELLRDHTGAIWQEGNARDKDNTLGTGFAIHRTIPRKKLRIFGAPRSMFGPTAPAYMKDALVAHRNRDYALAQHMTQKLLADGLVPDEDKDRVEHFLDSVKTLKESIEYDLTFTEGLLSKQNYVLASIELAQLQMVVSPDNPRLKAIAKVVESNKDKIRSRESIKDAGLKAYLANRTTSRKANEEKYRHELANTVTFVKDNAAYKAPLPRSRREGQEYYPKFSGSDLSQCRLLTIDSIENAPQGWEQTDFDDSKWKKATFGTAWPKNKYGLIRTSFEVNDSNAFKNLRVRYFAFHLKNMTLYLNGEIVAMGTDIPNMTNGFNLNPSALKLLKPGKNTLAISIQRTNSSSPLSIRLDAMRKDQPGKSDATASQKNDSNVAALVKNPPSQPIAATKPTPQDDQIAFMLGQLKNINPRMLVGDKEFPAIQVHDYLASEYARLKIHVTSTDIFLDKLATKSRSGLVYYVVDDKNNKVPLKDWFVGCTSNKQ